MSITHEYGRRCIFVPRIPFISHTKHENYSALLNRLSGNKFVQHTHRLPQSKITLWNCNSKYCVVFMIFELKFHKTQIVLRASLNITYIENEAAEYRKSYLKMYRYTYSLKSSRKKVNYWHASMFILWRSYKNKNTKKNRCSVYEPWYVQVIYSKFIKKEYTKMRLDCYSWVYSWSIMYLQALCVLWCN